MRKRTSMYKKSLIVLICLCMNLMSLGQVFADSATPASVGNRDTTGHWAENVLKQWQDQGLLKGYEDGSLKPNAKITRAEFTALVNKSFGYTDSGSITLKDVIQSSWYYLDITKAISAGYITGYPDQTFKPNQSLTREEMATIVASVLQLKESAPVAVFKDIALGHEWSKGPIGAVVEAGLMVGYDQKFRPTVSATRAEAVSVLDRALKFSKNKETVIYNEAGTYGSEKEITTLTGSVYIDAADIVLRNTIITGDLIIGEGVGNGDVSLKNVTVKGTTTINGGGKNSIHVIDSTLVTVIVNKKDGSIRIVTEGSGSVQQITLQSGALLEEAGVGNGFGNVNLSSLIPTDAHISLAGTFETVDVFAASIQVNLLSGAIQQLQVAPEASNTSVDLTSGARINALILNAIARITGQGTIGTATINASGSTIAQTPENVIRGDNVIVTVGTPTVISGGSTGGDNGTVTEIVYGFEGTVTDVDNHPVADMTIHFRKGLGATTGMISTIVQTDANGHYFANLAPGIYTGELVKSGFITTYVVGVSLSTQKNIEQDATAIKIPAADEIRIVLTWDERPLDEDSHLVGPTPNNRFFHTWYGDRQYYSNGELYADLDHDDVDSYGPETTTIRKRVDGTYTFYVYNYSLNGAEGTSTLSASGAKVEIYNGDNTVPVKTYHIPVADSEQLYWHVFNMTVNGSELTFEDKNELTDTQPLADVEIDYGSEPQLPTMDQISVENNPGATDVLKVSGLSTGDILSIDSVDFSNIVTSNPVPEGTDAVQISNLDFGVQGGILYISVTSQDGSTSNLLQISVLSEADYASLGTTIAGAFADHSVPSTVSVGQAVYLADPQQILPEELIVKVLSIEPVSSVTQDVYLDYNMYQGRRIILSQYNGTNEALQYKVTVELKWDYSSVTKEIILTVPTVFSALDESLLLAQKILNIEANHALSEAVRNASVVLSNPASTLDDYSRNLSSLNYWISVSNETN